jgi:hypothetical protein
MKVHHEDGAAPDLGGHKSFFRHGLEKVALWQR